jgi:hypothetical protein
MDSPTLHRTLIVANRTASTPLLLEEVARRAAARPTAFTLLVPDVPARRSADWTLDGALTLIRRAVRASAGTTVDGLAGGPDAFTSVKDALSTGGYDDVIISTLPARLSEWLRRDLPNRVRQLGVPVHVITPESSGENYLWERFKAFGPKGIG